MAQVAAFEDVKSGRTQREVPGGNLAWRTVFIAPDENDPATPHAFLVEGTPGRVIRPHFHDMDQFQVVVHGGGVLGKHALASHAVHFARGHTPYGPIVFGENGLGFLTLRAHRDPGAQYMHLPEIKDKLSKMDGRKPWQVTELAEFEPPVGEAGVNEFSRIRDEQGLASYAMSVKPNATAAAPDPSDTNGQYLIITKGGLMYEGREHKALTIVFVTPHETPFQLAAGPEGLEALVLHFPRKALAAAEVAPAAAHAPAAAQSARYRVWQCALCSFIYDEAKGMPDEGVAAGTRWEDVPESWTCPDCSASKGDFQMSVVG